MRNNDILRRLRFALNIKDEVMVNIFSLGECKVTKDEMLGYLKKEEEEGYLKCSNKVLIAFLEGLIIYKRGRQEEKEGAKKEKIDVNRNNLNNVILRKLRIALSFKSDDMIGIFKLAGLNISSSELSALFRSEEHRNYMRCGDKYIRDFLKGLTIYYRNV